MGLGNPKRNCHFNVILFKISRIYFKESSAKEHALDSKILLLQNKKLPITQQAWGAPHLMF
jgi:hypothetical protein